MNLWSFGLVAQWGPRFYSHLDFWTWFDGTVADAQSLFDVKPERIKAFNLTIHLFLIRLYVYSCHSHIFYANSNGSKRLCCRWAVYQLDGHCLSRIDLLYTSLSWIWHGLHRITMDFFRLVEIMLLWMFSYRVYGNTMPWSTCDLFWTLVFFWLNQVHVQTTRLWR